MVPAIEKLLKLLLLQVAHVTIHKELEQQRNEKVGSSHERKDLLDGLLRYFPHLFRF